MCMVTAVAIIKSMTFTIIFSTKYITENKIVTQSSDMDDIFVFTDMVL